MILCGINRDSPPLKQQNKQNGGELYHKLQRKIAVSYDRQPQPTKEL